MNGFKREAWMELAVKKTRELGRLPAISGHYRANDSDR
jgi:hypothetical protein